MNRQWWIHGTCKALLCPSTAGDILTAVTSTPSSHLELHEWHPIYRGNPPTTEIKTHGEHQRHRQAVRRVKNKIQGEQAFMKFDPNFSSLSCITLLHTTPSRPLPFPLISSEAPKLYHCELRTTPEKIYHGFVLPSC